MFVLENTPSLQNVICCTLCSCTASRSSGCRRAGVPLGGRAPVAHARKELDLRDEVEIKVWDTTTDTRYMVLPVQPPKAVGRPEDKLAEIVTEEAMIGVARLEPRYR
jgi:nitrile hydratase